MDRFLPPPPALILDVGGAAGAVLFFGPLYHLTDFNQRLRAIGEARRVSRAGGVLLAVAISRFASALDGIARGLIRDPDFARILEQDMEAGFPNPVLCAIEGPLWTVPESATAEQQETVMATMRKLESEPTLIGASAHIMAAATK